ncbi:MAG: response regulator transcription factor [Alphaproteobacteria bacterium]|nr:response regulator transcription factor [Alphaproteobacteria bacterium]
MSGSLSPALKPHILVVDDDDRLRGLLQLFLHEHGFLVVMASGAAMARAALRSLAFDLIVLDVMMPGESGLEFARSLRARGQDGVAELPVLFLTARAEPQERIEGLETGADDYLTKPFEPRELLLRIHAILRRKPQEKPKLKPLRLGAWIYDPARDILRGDKDVLRLTDVEARLMRLLVLHAGRPVSREALGEAGVAERTIDVQITRLRRKIEGDARNPRYLVTVRGEGYCLMPDEEGLCS